MLFDNLYDNILLIKISILFNNNEVEMDFKKLTLLSVNKNDYPDLEIKCKIISNISTYVRQLIDNGQKIHYAQKTSSVIARAGIMGEEIDTRPRVTRQNKLYVIGETKSKVKVKGSMVVTNPDGEQYIVEPDKFKNKYSTTSKKGVFKPIEAPIKYILINEDIVFTAPWGEEMYCTQGGVLNITNLDDIYAIQNMPFNTTYTNIKMSKKYNKNI